MSTSGIDELTGVRILDSHPTGRRSTDKHRGTGRLREFVLLGLVLLVVIPAVVAMYRIAFLESNTDARTPGDAVNAATSEAMIQMAQWTITSVLAIGGALVGLNRYQSEKRHEHDRQRFEDRISAEIDERLSEYKQYLDMVTRATIVSLDGHAVRMVKDTVGPKDGSIHDLNYVERVIRAFDNASVPLFRRGAGLVLLEEVMNTAGALPGSPALLTQERLTEIDRVAQELAKEFPDIGEKLQIAVRGYRTWHQSLEDASGRERTATP